MNVVSKLKLVIIIFIFSTVAGFAQMPNFPGMRDSSMRGGMNRDSAFKNMPAICKVIGTLQDSLTKAGLEFTSVAVLKVRDSSIVGGTLTNGKGQFSIEALQPGRYFLRISAIGYRKMDSKPFMLNPVDPTKDFGIVYVASSQKNLKEVEIQGERTDYVNSLDKKIYNVERDLVSTGGTASDVLRNVPSVNVDIDGKVSLRGSENLTILIDGKPSSLGGGDRASLLQQLPAGSIDQIEIITNPSARYDAEGMAGIINIKTKKDKRSGVNGSVTIGAGTRDKYNGGVSVNNRTKKTNLNLSYNFREETRWSSGFSLRQNQLAYLSRAFEDSQSEGRNQNYNNSFRSSLDINLSNNTTLGVSAGYSQRNSNNYELINTNFEDSIKSELGGFYRTTNSDNTNKNLEGGLDIRHVIPGTKRELSASANYSQSNNNDEDYFLTVDGTYGRSTLRREGQFSTLVAQSDYTHPINQNAKFETGVKGTFRTSDNDQVGLNRDGFDVANTDHFIYSDEITAAYLQFAGKAPTLLKKDKFVELQGGLRVENTRIIGNAVIDANDFEYNYANLFPSAAIKYTVKEKNDFQIVYSKRVNRPNPQNLNPFTDISDVRNVRTGNPRLQPEFVDSYEFNYFRKIKEHSISATLYYRYTNNLISRFRTIDSLGVSTMTFINYSSSANTGLEMVVKNQFGKAVSATTTFNYFNNKINGENIDAALQSTSNNWTLRTNINIKASKTTSLQVTGFYMSEIRNPQGTFRGMSGIDIGARRDFMKGKLNVSVNITDIFDTRKMIIHNVGEGFVYDAERKRESRVANFTLVYRFGSTESNLFQRKKSNRQMEAPMDMNPDF